MNFTTEKLENVNIDELKQLIKLHFGEVPTYDDIEPNINWDVLIKLDNRGIHKLFLVKRLGKIVGYASVQLGHSIEFSKTYCASFRNIFIHPKFRGVALFFIKWCDEQLKKLSVQVVDHHVKLKKDYGKLLERLGYEKINVEYVKRLDKD